MTTPLPSNPLQVHDPHSASPALRDNAGEAFEFKYLVSEELAREVEARFRPILALDPHADPALGGSYAITSLYCDTPRFDVFYRDRGYKSRKYRVRRYGDSQVVFLERKTVKQRRVRKLRTEIAAADLKRAALAGEGDAAWFSRQTTAKELAPVCRVRYLRRAMYGVCSEGPLRVTFDRSVRGAVAKGWCMDVAGEERTLLDGVVVCEFKFVEAMPAPMKAVASALALEPSGISKYRACVQAFGAELGVGRIAGNRDSARLTGADGA